jgi:hypothetical protein
MDIEEPRTMPTNLIFNRQSNNFVQPTSQTYRNNNNNINNNISNNINNNNISNRNNNNINSNNINNNNCNNNNNNYNNNNNNNYNNNNNNYNNTNNCQNNNANNNNSNGTVLMNGMTIQQQSIPRGVGQNYGEGDRLNQYRSNYQSPDQRMVVTGMQTQQYGVLNLSNKVVQQYPQPIPQKIMVP